MEQKATQDRIYYLPRIDTPRDLVKAICGMLNTPGGGVIFVGFDKNEHLVGVDEKVYQTSISNAYRVISPNFENLLSEYSCNDFVTEEGKRGYQLRVYGNHRESSLYRTNDIVPKFYLFNNGKIYTYTDPSRVQMLSDYSDSGLPFILNYEPSDTAKRIEQRKIQDINNVEIHSIGELPKGNYFYKYVDLETLLVSLNKNTMRFVEPTMWADKYESRFYNANYSLIGAKSSDIPFLYACCFTYSRESEAAWKVYSYQKTGLGAHCVELRIKRTLLRERLIKNLKDCRVFLGKVAYKDSSVINILHAPNIVRDGIPTPTEYYDTYFADFNLYSYLNLILLKREAFRHEKEVRCLIIPNDSGTRTKSFYNKNGEREKKSVPLDVEIDWLDIIDAIQIDSNCSSVEQEILTDRINILIDKRKDLTVEEKDVLKKRLKPTPFDVYGTPEEITIGEDIIKSKSSQ